MIVFSYFVAKKQTSICLIKLIFVCIQSVNHFYLFICLFLVCDSVVVTMIMIITPPSPYQVFDTCNNMYFSLFFHYIKKFIRLHKYMNIYTIYSLLFPYSISQSWISVSSI
ncbi:hypothetical protein Smp_180920 [Schistosoma mansoni]|uniref:hypothetical protein n=1 Tax=Schistosoma mansoni TaxID=6183 RepID=UPI0001A62C70|nr:hypothetical protein Smp_180920 [Schistosoma mansoni]|eukprot:XP_018649704.1 hypothetical protein Smp_180920 [Schistosoma mansoni]